MFEKPNIFIFKQYFLMSIRCLQNELFNYLLNGLIITQSYAKHFHCVVKKVASYLCSTILMYLGLQLF